MVVDVLAETPAAADAVALLSRERAWTYGELDGEVTRRAEALRREGATAGRIVPVTLSPDEEGVLTLLSLWRAGAVVAPLNSKLTEAERAAARAGLEGVTTKAQAVLWTSGTAGRPHGVALGFDAIRASTEGAARRLDLSGVDVWLASLSPAHVGGLVLVARSVLLGATLVAVGPFDAAGTLELMGGRGLPAGRGPGLTHISVVPTQLLRLLDEAGDRPPPQSFRCALVGGAKAPPDLVERALAAGWPIALTYGLTEATSQVATAPPSLTRRKPGTVGRPLDGVEVGLGEGGEILVRGRTLASGYAGPGGEKLIDPDGWHHTGDLGGFDEEGDLWVLGRRTDRIVSGGVTVDAVEVEEALRAHPRVADACVVGVPDAEWGERVSAWVVPLGADLAPEDLDAYLRGVLSAPKRPRAYRMGSELPLNANGKVDRRAVREALGRG